MPRIEDLIDGLANAQFISTLDLTKGYWQVPMAKSSIPKTAFPTQFGKFQVNVMPFGLVGAPACFQRLMNELLADHAEYSAAYMNDVDIFSLAWEDHLRHLEKVFNCLRKAGLTAKPAKCHLGMCEVEYLGHTVGVERYDHRRPRSKQ